MSLINKYPLMVLVSFGFFAVCVSVLINILLLRFSKTLGMRELQQKNIVRWSSSYKPSLGGISFFIIMLLSISIYSIIENTTIYKNLLLGVFFSTSLGFLIGLADDAYNTNPLLKFIGQLICANLMIFFGVYIHIHSGFMINYIFTCLWVVGIMNSINMLDNMDGITATVSLSIILLLLILSFNISDMPVINLFNFMLIGIFAALGGFLFFNWPPSKMYMGDSGSQLLGAFLSGMGIVYLWNYNSHVAHNIQVKQFIMPLAVFIIPIIDTTTVFIRRISKGNSPFIGGKDHTTHILVYFGIREKFIPILLSLITLSAMPVVYFFITDFHSWKPIYSKCVILYFILLFIAAQYLYYAVDKKQKTIH